MACCYDLIRSVTLILGIGYSAQQDKKTWLWADSVLWGCYGLGLFFFPGILCPGNDSAMMAYLVRVFASLIIGMEVMWYSARRTRDDYVVGALLWTRLMSSLLLLAIMSYSYSQFGDKFDNKMLFFDGLAYVGLLLTTVYQFWRGEYHVGGREQKGHISSVLRINFLILFFTGLLNLTYPSWVIPFKRLTQMETFMMRSIGAMFFGLSFTAWYATSFRYDDDRSAFFLSEIVSCVLMFLSLNIAYFHSGLFNPKEALVMHLGSVPALVVLLGMYLLWKKTRASSQAQSTYYTRSKVQ